MAETKNSRKQRERRRRDESRDLYLWVVNGLVLMKRIERSRLYLSVKSTVENPERIAMIMEIFGFPRRGHGDTCPQRLPQSNLKVEIPEYFLRFQPDHEKSWFD